MTTVAHCSFYRIRLEPSWDTDHWGEVGMCVFVRTETVFSLVWDRPWFSVLCICFEGTLLKILYVLIIKTTVVVFNFQMA